MTKQHVFAAISAIILAFIMFYAGTIILTVTPNGLAQMIMVSITTAVCLLGLSVFIKISEKKEIPLNLESYREGIRATMLAAGIGITASIVVPISTQLIPTIFSVTIAGIIFDLDMRCQKIFSAP